MSDQPVHSISLWAGLKGLVLAYSELGKIKISVMVACTAAAGFYMAAPVPWSQDKSVKYAHLSSIGIWI